MVTRVRRIVRIVALVFISVTVVGSMFAETPKIAPGLSRVTVQGRQVAAGKYMIAIQTQLARPEQFDGVLVFGEPSHTLLLAEGNGQQNGIVLNDGERPLASVQGPLASSAPQLVVPYEAAGDTRIVVEFTAGASRLTVSDAKINVAAFQFSTTFVTSPGANAPMSDPFRHCVTCGSCGTMCVDCDTPQFTANCITCTIRCGW